MFNARSGWAGFLLIAGYLLISSVLSNFAFGALTITWDAKYYNPKPLPGDLLLPMRCGGAMVFRAVEIPSDSKLDDRRVELGYSDQDLGYKEGRRTSYIAGAFTDRANEHRRFYYISKYETTRDQYAAMIEQECPKPSMQGRLPVVNVSWFDAVDFTRRFTEWLMENGRDNLPREGEELGFLRLPTEVEWEFAARGGLAVSRAEYMASVFPMPDGDLADYVWYDSTQSADGKLRPVGLLKPNPLGLYDVLGNAAEMVFVPFQLDHRGRLHGQAGGCVTRGGDIFTPQSQVRTAERQELNYFDAETGKAKSLSTIGFRLVLATPVIVSKKRLEEIKQDWLTLPKLEGDVGEKANDARQQVHSVAQQTQNPELRAKLESAERELEDAHTQIKESRDRVLRALIRMGAFLAKRVSTDYIAAEGIQRVMDSANSAFQTLENHVQGKPNSAETINIARADLDSKMQKWRKSLRERQESLKNSIAYYGDMVTGVAAEYSNQMIDRQLQVVLLELRERKNEYLIPYGQLFARHIKQNRNDGKAEESEWLQEIVLIAGKEGRDE